MYEQHCVIEKTIFNALSVKIFFHHFPTEQSLSHESFGLKDLRFSRNLKFTRFSTECTLTINFLGLQNRLVQFY